MKLSFHTSRIFIYVTKKVNFFSNITCNKSLTIFFIFLFFIELNFYKLFLGIFEYSEFI